MQEKFEARRTGRLLISVFVIVTIGSMVIWNMPGSKLRDEGMRFARSYIDATGLDQNWSVFAPNPTSGSFEMYARVEYANGTRGRWYPPGGGSAVGAYWDFRWIKWAEWTTDGFHKDLCQPTAGYIANREFEAGRRATRVELIRRWRPNFPPGHQPPHGRWRDSLVCVARVVAKTDTS